MQPRLGPKPFSSSQNSQEFSFDKVFSVPSAPVTQSGGSGSECSSPPIQYNNGVSPDKEQDSPLKSSPTKGRPFDSKVIFVSIRNLK